MRRSRINWSVLVWTVFMVMFIVVGTSRQHGRWVWDWWLTVPLAVVTVAGLYWVNMREVRRSRD